jgi:hypothetical protein
MLYWMISVLKSEGSCYVMASDVGGIR